MGYTPTVWVNDVPPPIDQTNLNHIEQGIAAAALRVEDIHTVAASGAAQAVPDVGTATLNLITLTANCTFTFPAAAAGKSFVVALVQGGAGSFTATWPGTVKWSTGAPSLTTTVGKTDVFSFICLDGANWLGGIFGQGF